jgi:hypothetical protein
MVELLIKDNGALSAYQELARLLVGKREAYLCYRKAIKKGLRLFVSRAECLPAKRASKKVVFLEPSDGLLGLLAAIRAGELEFKLFIQNFLRHSPAPKEQASSIASSARE